MFLFPFDPTQLPPTLALFLAGLAAASGVIANWIFTHVPIFGGNPPDWLKQVFSVGLGILLTGLLTWFTSMASPDTVARLNAYYLMIVQILITIAGAAGYHVAYQVGYRGLFVPVSKYVQYRLAVPHGSQG